MHIIFVRHGETAYNAIGRYQGHMQISLNDTGFSQARHVGERLQHHNFDAIYSSDLLRAVQTAKAIAHHHDQQVIELPGFREIDVGLWEHLTVAEISAQFPTDFAAYRIKPGRTIYTGGESYAQMQTRAMQTLAAIMQRHDEHDTICVVCHGGTIRAIVCAVLNLDIDNYTQMWIDNCAITTIIQHQGKLRLGNLNDNAHAMQHKQD
ncbi:MAG: histidine phosphatase family protein [Chloroflexales bacterium]|nr:histidine phosphatase family protein [Chloroflexales bacterium]